MVLVTGASGLLGGELVKQLVAKSPLLSYSNPFWAPCPPCATSAVRKSQTTLQFVCAAICAPHPICV
ncbi:unnamed protein product, partial [Rotaria sp. Silwood2]